jgi:nucleotide-binding universal stress UspA family protein
VISRKPPDRKAAAKRAALRALRKAKRLADKEGVELSAWEGEFLGSVEQRVETYGRAFADPEKGAAGQALSAMQTRKLKEIAAKAKGEAPKPRWRRRGDPEAE